MQRVFSQATGLLAKNGVFGVGEFFVVAVAAAFVDEFLRGGEALPIWLEELRRCRQHFIGLLGGRYSWIPVANPVGLSGSLAGTSGFASMT